MFGTAVSRVALLRNARNGVTGKDVTAHSAAVGQELTVPRKHKDGLRWYKTVLNHLIPSKR